MFGQIDGSIILVGRQLAFPLAEVLHVLYTIYRIGYIFKGIEFHNYTSNSIS